MEVDRRQGFLPTAPGQILTIYYVHTGSYELEYGRMAPTMSADAESFDDQGDADAPTELSAQPSGQDDPGNLESGPPEPSSAADPTPEDSDVTPGDATASSLHNVHFLIFTPDYAPEQVSLHLAPHTPFGETLEAIDTAREPGRRHLFPVLLPVHVQPLFSIICLLALPSWPYEGVPFLITSFVPPVRVLAVVGPANLTAADVLRLSRPGLLV